MKNRTFITYVMYIWTKTLIGLTFTPFQSVREVTRRPVLLPVIFSPFFGILILLAAGKTASLLITVYGLKREFVALLLSTTLLSIILWQGLLLYLLLSFLIASWRKKYAY